MYSNQNDDIEALHEKCNAFFYDNHPEAYISDLKKLLSCSEFARKQFSKSAEKFGWLLKDNDLNCQRNLAEYQTLLSNLDLTVPQVQYYQMIRQFRNREMIRIAWRAIGLNTSLEPILSELSALADSCLMHALTYAKNLLQAKCPECLNDSKYKKLFIIALGKLGGNELNFSSDIDIYFTYPIDPKLNLNDAQLVSNYYNLLAKTVVQLLSETTKDGFVYRVDLRLRPNGQAGAIAINFKSLENYYQEQGRDWERYAMVKARVVNPDNHFTPLLNNTLHTFVYRKYVDFTILESLRSLKITIQREVKLKNLQQDIKRGPGGIREIEFICQTHQLIRGGRIQALQVTSIFTALQVLTEKGILKKADAKKLKDAYVFFRTVENAIQMHNDKQLHALPTDAAGQQQLLLSLDFKRQLSLEKKLQHHRQQVSNIFNTILEIKALAYQTSDKVIKTQLLQLCHAKLGDIPSEDLLLSFGFKSPNNAYQILMHMIQSHRYKKLSQVAKLRFEKFLPLLLQHLNAHQNIDNIFFQFITLIDKLLKRSSYLALLTENPTTLQHLIRLFSLSPWIAEHVTTYPFMLEGLLDLDSLYRPPSEKMLLKEMAFHLSQACDFEQQINQLKQFKLMQQLCVAAAFVTEQIPAFQAATHLSRTAIVILQQVYDIATKELVKKHPEYAAALNKFAIIAYGKLGSHELCISSDLDLVFLHNCDVEEEVAISKLARKILLILNTRTFDGVLYNVDTRLRPSGSAGLLISHIKAFAAYQKEKAWTWEHQSLTKAKMICGPQDIANSFNQIRQEIIMQQRSLSTLAQDISEMRCKMKKENKGFMLTEIKQQDNGLIDVEFMVQFISLKFSQQYPKLVEARSVLEVLDIAKQLKILDTKTYNNIVNYCDLLNQRLHQQMLVNESSYIDIPSAPVELAQLMQKWQLNFILTNQVVDQTHREQDASQ